MLLSTMVSVEHEKRRKATTKLTQGTNVYAAAATVTQLLRV